MLMKKTECWGQKRRSAFGSSFTLFGCFSHLRTNGTLESTFLVARSTINSKYTYLLTTVLCSNPSEIDRYYLSLLGCKLAKDYSLNQVHSSLFRISLLTRMIQDVIFNKQEEMELLNYVIGYNRTTVPVFTKWAVILFISLLVLTSSFSLCFRFLCENVYKFPNLTGETAILRLHLNQSKEGN